MLRLSGYSSRGRFDRGDRLDGVEILCAEDYKMDEKSFCRECGSRKVAIPTGYFNEQTGEKETYLICPNTTKCSSACATNGEGHNFKGFWYSRCTKCGYPLPSSLI